MTAAITDFGQFADLRLGAKKNDRDPAVLREVAGQFEALFIQTMMKNMRDASFGEPIFGQSSQHEMYQEMLDKQYALEMAGGRGIGLADMLVRQLGGEPVPEEVPEPGAAATATGAADSPPWSKPAEFVRDVWPHAQEAAGRLNVAPEGLLAQAALETGWGRHVARRPDGAPSYNLFGVKASSSWAGPTATKPTLEYRAGIPERQVARFRAYPDIEATFDDYVQVVGNQPRFDAVRNHGDDASAFAAALQESGYATDPAYAAKINAIIASDTMKQALADLKSNEARPINRHSTHGERI